MQPSTGAGGIGVKAGIPPPLPPSMASDPALLSQIQAASAFSPLATAVPFPSGSNNSVPCQTSGAPACSHYSAFSFGHVLPQSVSASSGSFGRSGTTISSQRMLTSTTVVSTPQNVGPLFGQTQAVPHSNNVTLSGGNHSVLPLSTTSNSTLSDRTVLPQHLSHEQTMPPISTRNPLCGMPLSAATGHGPTVPLSTTTVTNPLCGLPFLGSAQNQITTTVATSGTYRQNQAVPLSTNCMSQTACGQHQTAPMSCALTTTYSGTSFTADGKSQRAPNSSSTNNYSNSSFNQFTTNGFAVSSVEQLAVKKLRLSSEELQYSPDGLSSTLASGLQRSTVLPSHSLFPTSTATPQDRLSHAGQDRKHRRLSEPQSSTVHPVSQEMSSTFAGLGRARLGSARYPYKRGYQ
jgi:hypothetical protein